MALRVERLAILYRMALQNASMKAMMKRTGMSRRSVFRYLKELEENKVIRPIDPDTTPRTWRKGIKAEFFERRVRETLGTPPYHEGGVGDGSPEFATALEMESGRVAVAPSRIRVGSAAEAALPGPKEDDSPGPERGVSVRARRSAEAMGLGAAPPIRVHRGSWAFSFVGEPSSGAGWEKSWGQDAVRHRELYLWHCGRRFRVRESVGPRRRSLLAAPDADTVFSYEDVMRAEKARMKAARDVLVWFAKREGYALEGEIRRANREEYATPLPGGWSPMGSPQEDETFIDGSPGGGVVEVESKRREVLAEFARLPETRVVVEKQGAKIDGVRAEVAAARALMVDVAMLANETARVLGIVAATQAKQVAGARSDAGGVVRPDGWEDVA